MHRTMTFRCPDLSARHIPFPERSSLVVSLDPGPRKDVAVGVGEKHTVEAS